jgi:ribonuclease HI
MQIKIYTDGGCSGNPGPGAWAFIINTYAGNNKKAASSIERAGGDEFTTNNRMELSAAIHALEAVPSLVKGRVSDITLITDSRYVQQGMIDWIETWKTNGWKSADGVLVKNAELWLKLDTVAKSYNVDWQWVKGHDGDEYNERCDTLVQQVIKKLKAAQPQGKGAPKTADAKPAVKGAVKTGTATSAVKKPAVKSAAKKQGGNK